MSARYATISLRSALTLAAPCAGYVKVYVMRYMRERAAGRTLPHVAMS